jgi:hypothetical protein
MNRPGDNRTVCFIGIQLKWASADGEVCSKSPKALSANVRVYAYLGSRMYLLESYACISVDALLSLGNA